MSIAGCCEFCNEPETTDHLFARCAKTKWLLKEVIEAAGGLVNLSPASTFEEAAKEINRTT